MSPRNSEPMTPEVRAVFDSFDADTRDGLLAIRNLIFDVASTLPEIGRVTEELRWGQPSYQTPKTKAATPIRLGKPKNGTFAIFAHCQSTVISDFTTVFPEQDRVDGNRAILFDGKDQIDTDRHRLLIKSALTYHL